MVPDRWATETVSARPEVSKRCTFETEGRGGLRKEGVIILSQQTRRPPHRYRLHHPLLRVHRLHLRQRLRRVVTFTDRNL